MISKRCVENLGANGYVHYFDYGDGFIGLYICQNLSDCTI